MTEAHSSWSASGFEAIMLCPGKKVLEAGLADNTSAYAAEGTAAHQVLTWALQDDRPASAYLGRLIQLNKAGRAIPEVRAGGDNTIAYEFTVDEDMAQHVQVCIDYVKDVAGDDGVILVDIKVNYSRYLDVPESDAWGTADVIVLRGDEIIVIDFKYGRGVEVSAEKNPQMSLYALGALVGYEDFGDFKRVRMAISQPRISVAPSEYDLTVEELEAWGNSTARSAVATAKNAMLYLRPNGLEMPVDGFALDTFLRPNEKSCKFCRAKATCPALRAEVVTTVTAGGNSATPEEFDDAMNYIPAPSASEALMLSRMLDKVDLIEDWCKAVRAEVERRMLAGDQVPGYKLVEGKQGNRAWGDEKAAEALLKSMRLKQEELYDFSVKSPTQIAKLGPAFDKDGKVKPTKEGTPPPVIGPRQWPKVLALITRAPPKKHVAPVSDPRPALEIKPAVDDFDDVSVEDLA